MMTPTSMRLAPLALLAALALVAAPLAVAQHGPPPGYTDPLVYAQDYADQQVQDASADPVGYAGQKTTPEGLDNETKHVAWLACWTAFDQGLPLDAVCSQFFIAPQTVDAPAEAEAEITETLNATGADAFVDETLDIVDDTLADPTSAVEQVQRFLGALQDFLGDATEFVVATVMDLVGGVLDALGLGRTAAGDAFGALGDGLLALVGLPLLGIQSAASGLGDLAGATVDGVAAAAGGLVGAAQAVGDGLMTGASATGDGLGSAAAAVQDAGAASVQAVGDAADAVVGSVQDAAQAVTDTVSGWFAPASGKGADDGGLAGGSGLETGTEADGLVDRLLGIL